MTSPRRRARRRPRRSDFDGFPIGSSHVSTTRGSCAPGPRGRSAASSSHPARPSGAPRRSRAGTPRPAGASRSRSRAACSPRYLPDGRDRAVRSSRARSPPACGRRAGRQGAVDGGDEVSGRWSFCSGIAHSDVLFAGCIVEGRRRSPPARRRAATDELEILDTWHTLGLRGTGSHDAVADQVVVPAERVFSLFDGPVHPPRRFIASRSSASSRSRSAPPRSAMHAARSRTSRSWPSKRSGRVDTRACGARADPRRRRPGGGRRCVRPRALLRRRSRMRGRRHRSRGAASVALRNALRLAATHAVRAPPTRSARCTTSPAAARSTTAHRCSAASATRTRRPPTSRSTPPHASSNGACCSISPLTQRGCETHRRGGAPLLARPPRRGGARHRRRGARRAGCDALWIGELATFDAVALATAIGTARRGGSRLKIGPLAIGVRSPVAIAFAASVGRDSDRQRGRRSRSAPRAL